MTNNTQWADVCHYYTDLPCLGIEDTPFTALWFAPKTHRKAPTHAYIIGQTALGKDEPYMAAPYLYKPILRCLDDITEDEARELWRLRAMPGEFIPGESGWDDAVWWVRWLNRYPIINWNYTQFVFLISRGFDVFGLIESGQAIRKGVQNG